MGASATYPLDVFPPAFALLDDAELACSAAGDRLSLRRVQFLRYGLIHARRCVQTAVVMNSPSTTQQARGAALAELAQYRRTVEGFGIANMDRASSIEVDSWGALNGFLSPWEGMPKH